jgi:Ethylbenzene dehydrogenase/Prokaryotic cytochrome b561
MGMGHTTIRIRRTDYGTVILHWVLVASVAVATITGLRIATESPGYNWTGLLDLVLPKAAVWTGHIEAAVLLIAVSLAYAVYMIRAGLGRRVRLDRVRLQGLLGRRIARWGVINIALYWLFYLAMLAQLVTGGLLYFGYSNSITVFIHWIGMWGILGYGVLHVAFHWQLGGSAQLLRILRPARLVPPPPPFDPADVLALLDEQASPPLASRQTTTAYAEAFDGPPGRAAHSLATDDDDSIRRPSVRSSVRPSLRSSSRPSPHPVPGANADRAGPRHPAGYRREPIQPHTRRSMIQLSPFIVASAAAIAGVTFVLAIDRKAVNSLHIRRVSAAEIPVIDGETSDPIWRKVPAIHVMTEQGENFGGKGETTVSIQAVHDGVSAYFLFIWDDPTRSLKQLPMRKSGKSWHLVHDGYENGDEHAYNEDKFSVLLTRVGDVLAGDNTFHAGASPAAGKPRTLSGRGLHYTTRAGVYADVWQWKATSTNPSKFVDDNHFGPPAEGTKAQFDGVVPYRGGFAPDPGSANYQDNFLPRLANEYGQGVIPRRLPKDVAAMTAALGRIELDPNQGDIEGARWYMTEEESVPYSPERDRQIPEGTVIPGVVISGKYSGDRADVRGAARWAAGRWALEVTRRLESSSRYDMPISTGIFMRVAAFDHAQIRHTRHVKPIRLEVE